MERVKAITEDFLRVELRNTQPEVYYIPEGKILTPAAREYLQQRKIKVAAGGQPAEPAPAAAPAAQPVVPTVMCAPEPPKPKYVDYETGAYYMEKPEHMTQLFGNVLVAKDHPRIHFRGKLDSLQALVVLDQVQIAEGGCQKLVDDLGNILGVQERDHHRPHPRRAAGAFPQSAEVLRRAVHAAARLHHGQGLCAAQPAPRRRP